MFVCSGTDNALRSAVNRKRFPLTAGAIVSFVLGLGLATSASAQGVIRPPSLPGGVQEPKTLTATRQRSMARPPSGMCRIWIDGVPAAKQPAPTDCVTALREKPANGRIIFGDALPRGLLPRVNVKKRPGSQGDY